MRKTFARNEHRGCRRAEARHRAGPADLMIGLICPYSGQFGDADGAAGTMASCF